MRGSHPNLNCVALVVAVSLAAVSGGCGANSQTASINPFLGPDRVPPPATRTLLPGAAQPYYPGDPLPTMQSATGGAPAASQSLAPVVIPAVAMNGGAKGMSGLAASNEPSVAIPVDNNALRFAAPKPPAEPSPFVPAPSSGPIAAAQPAPFAGSLAPAVFTQPIEMSSSETLAAPPTGPWRAPRVPASSLTGSGPPLIASAALTAPTPASPFAINPIPAQTQVAPMWSPPPSSMDVRLRAVPSPSPEPVAPTTPRIRLPGPPLQTQAYIMPDGTIQHVSYTVVPVTPNGGAVQTVGITALPSAGYGNLGALPPPPITAGQPQPTIIATRDGFRPRGSMK